MGGWDAMVHVTTLSALAIAASLVFLFVVGWVFLNKIYFKEVEEKDVAVQARGLFRCEPCRSMRQFPMPIKFTDLKSASVNELNP